MTFVEDTSFKKRYLNLRPHMGFVEELTGIAITFLCACRTVTIEIMEAFVYQHHEESKPCELQRVGAPDCERLNGVLLMGVVPLTFLAPRPLGPSVTSDSFP